MSENPPPPPSVDPPPPAYTPPPPLDPPPAAAYPGPMTPAYGGAQVNTPGGSSNKAILSIVFGAVGIFCPIFLFGIIGLVLAISARGDIQRSGGALGGGGAATGGLVVSIISLVLNVLTYLFWFAVFAAVISGGHTTNYSY